MVSVTSANVDISKFLALDKSKTTKATVKWKCSDFLLKMLEEGVHADVTFRANGGSVAAHKSVLACLSPVFLAILQHDKKELPTCTVDIPGMTIEALQLFLLLLYTTQEVSDEGVPQMPEFGAAIDKHFVEFHKAVLKYQVEGRLGCDLLSALARNLTPDNCWYHYNLSLLANPTNWKNSTCLLCRDYILGNYSEVIDSESFLEEMKRNPDRVDLVITYAECTGARKRALERFSRRKQSMLADEPFIFRSGRV